MAFHKLDSEHTTVARVVMSINVSVFFFHAAEIKVLDLDYRAATFSKFQKLCSLLFLVTTEMFWTAWVTLDLSVVQGNFTIILKAPFSSREDELTVGRVKMNIYL